MFYLLFIQGGSGASGGDDAPGASGGGDPGFFSKIVRKLRPRKKVEAKEEEKTPVLTNAERCRQYRENLKKVPGLYEVRIFLYFTFKCRCIVLCIT